MELHTSRLSRRPALAAAVLVPLGLAACGNRTVTRTDGSTTTVRFMLNWYPYGEHAPFYYGAEQGIFEEHGIDLRIEPGQGAAKTTQAVGAGEVNFGWADTPVVLGNIDNGVDVKSIGVFLQTTPSAVQFFADSGIDSAEDLAGLTIATSAGDAPTTTFPLFLEAAGLGAGEVTEQNIDPAGKNSALITGQVDALIGFAHDQSPIIAEASGKTLDSISYADVGLNFFSNGLITSGAQIAADRDIVQAMLDATSRSFAAAREDPEAAVAAMRGKDPQIAEPHVLLEQWNGTIDLLTTENSTSDVPGTNTEQDWETTISILADAEMIGADGSLEDYVDTGFTPAT
ncbi:ABC transporter substrate-binding protein [Brachybacterium sp. EE-P12]|uniref:ABC transporter substrate-binding protein n=1 Tax=Candidatus Brachybacterium intestinipullorum TaxID=2838512 RepID=A0A9D2PYK6_9MICO|nr:ABC transporter substrate-binding protein [Brachybacterium sp. EE-P12]HJC68166.1 ABC transporter substrate-binding protein [Candidatus Brachybacterium intestinipullorum]